MLKCVEMCWWKVRGSSESVGFILWEPWTSVESFTVDHLIDLDAAESRCRCPARKPRRPLRSIRQRGCFMPLPPVLNPVLVARGWERGGGMTTRAGIYLIHPGSVGCREAAFWGNHMWACGSEYERRKQNRGHSACIHIHIYLNVYVCVCVCECVCVCVALAWGRAAGVKGGRGRGGVKCRPGLRKRLLFFTLTEFSVFFRGWAPEEVHWNPRSRSRFFGLGPGGERRRFSTVLP